jgi:hypothetical protein
MDRLELMFGRQTELMHKYHEIEVASGLVQTEECPVDMNCQKGQARIKDFAWRFTEELAEALSAVGQTDFKEELMDGLHFLIELSILVGKGFDSITDFEPGQTEMDYLELLYQDGKELALSEGLAEDTIVVKIITNIGMMCNCLKNKPWKQTMKPTDTELFYKRLEDLWLTYFAYLFRAGFDSCEIFEGYFNKATINQARQRGNY